MQDFRNFVRAFRHALRVVEGIMAGLILTLFGLGVFISWAEDLPLSDGLYFTLITGLTVGYGDVSPVTPLGRLASIMAALIGVIITGIYVALATRAVGDAVNERNARLGLDD